MSKLRNGIELSVQSYTFRNFKTKELLCQKTKECGISSIEICGVHIDFTSVADIEEYLKITKGNGLATASVGVMGFSLDEVGLKTNFEFAKKADLKIIGADIDIDALPLVEKYCDEYGVRLGIHNHGRNHRYGSFEQLDNIFAKASKNIGLTMDTAWAIDAGCDPKEMIERYYDRLYGIHMKDMIYSDFAAGKFTECPCGDGTLKLDEISELVLSAPSLRYITIEYEGEPDDPVPAVKKCVENLIEALG